MKAKYLFIGILLSIFGLIAFAAPTNKTTTEPSTAAVRAAAQAPRKITNDKKTKTVVKSTGKDKSLAKPIKHLWNLQDVDIKRVVAEISRETGKNFIISPQVQGKVTIISSHPMGQQESYQVFLSTLRVLGYAVVPDGQNLKIVPARDAANQSRLATAAHPGYGDQVVVRAIPMHYVSAIQLVPSLRPLVPTWGNLAAYTPANSIIVSGTAENVQRLVEIIKQVDTPAANGIVIMHLKHAVASDIVNEVNKLVLAARAGGANTNASLSADEQSNSVLISGNATSRLRLKILIAKLDSENATGNNNTQVIYLNYIRVKDMLPILKAMIHESVSYSIAAGGASYTSTSTNSSNGSSNLGQASAQFTAAANNQINNATLNSSTGGASRTQSKTSIVGDVTNNALVVSADPALMLKLKNVITSLDVAPQQILVQGVIAEVNAQTAKQIGIQWGTGGPNQAGNSTANGETTRSPLGVTGGAPPGFAFAGGGLGVGFLRSGDFRALISLLASDTHTNLVSTPSITVLNNSPADIEVGQTISEVSSSYDSASTNPNILPPTTYNDKNIGLTLRVIPQVTGAHSVRLVIDQTNSSIVSGASSTGSPNPNTSTEKLNTQVLVHSGQVVVLAGFINAQDETVETKVPVLGDIPLIGHLFRNHSTTKVKRDLMIFLRPIILNTKAQSEQLAKQRYDFMRNVAILNAGNKSHLIASAILPSRHPAKLPIPFHQG